MKKLKKSIKAIIISLCLVVVLAGLWLGNIFSTVGAPSPLPFFNKEQAEVVEAPQSAPAAEAVVADTIPAAKP